MNRSLRVQDSATSASEARLHSTLEHIAWVQFWNFRRLAYSSKKTEHRREKGCMSAMRPE